MRDSLRNTLIPDYYSESWKVLIATSWSKWQTDWNSKCATGRSSSFCLSNSQPADLWGLRVDKAQSTGNTVMYLFGEQPWCKVLPCGALLTGSVWGAAAEQLLWWPQLLLALWRQLGAVLHNWLQAANASYLSMFHHSLGHLTHAVLAAECIIFQVNISFRFRSECKNGQQRRQRAAEPPHFVQERVRFLQQCRQRGSLLSLLQGYREEEAGPPNQHASQLQ